MWFRDSVSVMDCEAIVNVRCGGAKVRVRSERRCCPGVVLVGLIWWEGGGGGGTNSWGSRSRRGGCIGLRARWRS